MDPSSLPPKQRSNRGSSTHTKLSILGHQKSQNDSLQRKRRVSFTKLDEPASRLVRIELDAAEVLAGLSRLRHPTRRRTPTRDKGNSLPRWSGKRRRSGLATNYDAPADLDQSACAVAIGASLAHQLNKQYPENFSTVKCKGLEWSRTMPEFSKESHTYDSRAESPTSPLPSMVRACRPMRNSASLRHTVPVKLGHKPCALAKNTKIGKLGSYALAASLFKKITRKKQRDCKSPVKLEQPEEIIDDLKVTKCVESVMGEFEKKNYAESVRQIKPKASLTEIEKDARRLHRLHANRQSARQTICRKQMQCKELMKQASSLALENEDMNQKKQMLVQELYRLKELNCHLKQQLETDSCNLRAESRQQWPVDPPTSNLLGPPYWAPIQSFVWSVAASPAITVNRASGSPPSNACTNESGYRSPASNETCAMGEACEQKSGPSCYTLQDSQRNSSAAVVDHEDPKGADLHDISATSPSSCLPLTTSGNIGNFTARVYSSHWVPLTQIKEEESFEGSYLFGRTRSLAAAEARKRRKELTRGKFLQSRALRLRC